MSPPEPPMLRGRASRRHLDYSNATEDSLLGGRAWLEEGSLEPDPGGYLGLYQCISSLAPTFSLLPHYHDVSFAPPDPSTVPFCLLPMDYKT